MATARDLIQSSLRLIGAVQKSEPISADEAQDGLEVLNDLLASWANDSLMVYSRTWQEFPILGGIGDYTMGVGGDFNTARPTQIISAYIRIGDDLDYPLSSVTDDEYALAILDKSSQSSPSSYFNYDNGYPLGKFRIWPVPATSASIHLQTEKQVLSLTSVNDEINLPPGWNRALRYNLALELAPEYGVEPSVLVANSAAESKGIIKQQALKNRPLTFISDGWSGYYDVYSDTFR